MSDYQAQTSSADTRINEAIKFWRLVNDADSNNRAEALNDIKFAAGDQWPVEIQNSRNVEARPCLTINKIDAYIRQVTNQQRQQRPRLKVQAVNNLADYKVAQVIEGIMRHIEVNSNADTAYDTAFDYAVRMGWGYWRINTRYTSEDSFDQEIYIDTIDNPFTVYFDPNSVLPDGSDAERCLITTVLDKKIFREMYPNADDGASFAQRSTGDDTASWVTKEDIRLAEYFYIEREKAKLYLLSDGSRHFADSNSFFERVEAAGLTVLDQRESFRKAVKWVKMTAMEIIEEKTWAGKYIPVVPCYGAQVIVDDKRKKYGLVRFAKDPQRMYNFWRTSMTESIALAPKAKWLLAEGQDEGHESEWALANIKSSPVLRYKQKDIDGAPAPIPQRLQPEPPPLGIMEAAGAISADLQMVLGILDPNQLPSGNISGKALAGQQNQVDLSNFHFYDNMTRSIRHTGKIILDLVPKIYDTQRVMRIIGSDGQPSMTTINEQKVGDDGIQAVLNDVTVGEYDVVMDTGPGFMTKRQQAVDALMPLMAKPELFNVAGDLVFRNMDFPGADVIADRLAAMNPLAQIDEKSDIPPQVQMELAQAKKTVQDMQNQMAAMQLAMQQRADIEQVKQDAETKRELMRQTAKAHNTETMAEVKVNDQNTRAITSQNKTEIEAIVDLLLHRMDTGRLNEEIARRNAEQNQYAQFAAQDIDMGQSPLLEPQQPQGAPPMAQ
ncbi:Phage P22-like portal protein [uncultured Caudovirales phage]|uniref:Phage P22-like portal protein n=1 Tax=uncultured Caudovirales phage TaxID=2100421 RepID=A0A6J5T8R5_9CAUD|nr:Phage P22-like portal protein [uncultured Caudovirales phage]